MERSTTEGPIIILDQNDKKMSTDLNSNVDQPNRISLDTKDNTSLSSSGYDAGSSYTNSSSTAASLTHIKGPTVVSNGSLSSVNPLVKPSRRLHRLISVDDDDDSSSSSSPGIKERVYVDSAPQIYMPTIMEDAVPTSDTAAVVNYDVNKLQDVELKAAAIAFRDDYKPTDVQKGSEVGWQPQSRLASAAFYIDPLTIGTYDSDTEDPQITVPDNWDDVEKVTSENQSKCSSIISCFCCNCCPKKKNANRVVPEGVDLKQALKEQLKAAHDMEYAPPEYFFELEEYLASDTTGEGRNLFLADGKKRIDYVLVWNCKEKDPDKAEERDKMRQVFERNLEEEGLILEHDIQDDRDLQYTKIHATFEVLCRYAEIMKNRMPIKEVPEEIKAASFWEVMTDYATRLLSPFELDPYKVPPMPKKFTHVFERDKSYLYAIPPNKERFFSHGTRNRIVDYILRRKKYSDNVDETFAFGIKRLLNNDTYDSAYPLHEGSWKPWTKLSMRRMLYENWAKWHNWYKLQPLDYVRVYFGERIGIYFAWLGYYTYMLIIPSIVGLIVFIYGVATINSNNPVADQTCGSNFTMCPLCDLRCPYWSYSAICPTVRATHIFDNGATVFFAIFMSLWGTMFLEFWKREQSGIQFKWNLMNFEEEEEPPRPEYIARMANSKFKKPHEVTGVEEPYLPFWRWKFPVYLCSFATMLFLCLVAIGVLIGVIVYRMSVLSALYLSNNTLLYSNAATVTSVTAALINLVVIFILNFIYSRVAVKLTDWECWRTQSEYDSSLTFKLYFMQFVNYYASLFYIAFFKGRFAGRPGDYNTFFGARQQECAGGCLMDLCIQLAIIFVGKQLIQNNLMEIFLPRLKRFLKRCFCKSDEEKKKLAPWEKDYELEDMGPRGVFNEYLEMLIQFGFVTLFVAAFPLAPLFALLNNIIEIRADANKFVTQYRRPMAARSATIGIWYSILYGVSRFAVLTNAFIIAITSNFIQRMVYRYGGYTPIYGSMVGYVNNSLSYFNVTDLPSGTQPIDPGPGYNGTELCRYTGYRTPPWSDPPYVYTTEYWHIVAAQFIFVVVYQNVAIFTTSFLAYIIPDMPAKLKEQVRRENYLTNEIIIKTELEIMRGEDGILDDNEMSGIRRRAKLSLRDVVDSMKPTPASAESGPL